MKRTFTAIATSLSLAALLTGCTGITEAKVESPAPSEEPAESTISPGEKTITSDDCVEVTLTDKTLYDENVSEGGDVAAGTVLCAVDISEGTTELYAFDDGEVGDYIVGITVGIADIGTVGLS